MPSSITVLLFGLLPSFVASEVVTVQHTLTLLNTVTETKTVVVPTEPNVPPAAGWPTSFLSPGILNTEVLFSTLPDTITRTLRVSSTSTDVYPYTCITDDSVLACGYYPTAASPSIFNCIPTSSVITYSYTELWCRTSRTSTHPWWTPSHTSSSVSPSYSCDPLVNVTCWGNVSTWSLHTTSTAHPIDTTIDSAAGCQETRTSITSVPIRSTQSNSPHSQSSSSHSTSHTSGGYYPSTTSPPPVTAGSAAGEPRIATCFWVIVLVGIVGFT